MEVTHCGWEMSVGSQSLGTAGFLPTSTKVPGVPAHPFQNCHISPQPWLLTSHPPCGILKLCVRAPSGMPRRGRQRHGGGHGLHDTISNPSHCKHPCRDKHLFSRQVICQRPMTYIKCKKTLFTHNRVTDTHLRSCHTQWHPHPMHTCNENPQPHIPRSLPQNAKPNAVRLLDLFT